MLLSNLNLLATAPDGVARLRELILTLAVQGKLLPQDPNDEPASVLLKKIRAEKDRLIAEGKIKRDKPLAEIAEDEKPFDLPAGWEWVRLADVVQVLNGRAYGKQELLDAGTPVLRVGNLFTSNHWYYSNLELEPAKYCEQGDLLYAWSASFGPFIWSGPKAIYHYHIWKLEPLCRDAFDTSFFHTYLTEKTAEIKAAGHGVSMVHMTKEKMEKIVVPYPPLAEQSRIVTRVEELMRLCDALSDKARLEATQHAQLVATLLGTLTAASGAGAPDASAPTPGEPADPLHARWQRIAPHFDQLLDRPEAVDALEQTILQLAVRGLLTSRNKEEATTVQPDNALVSKGRPTFLLPEQWRWFRLGDLAELINGDRGQNYPNKAEYVSKGIPFINTGHIDPDGSLSQVRMNFLTREKFNSLRGGKVRKGDLVYCLRGATLGKTAIVDYEEGAIASSLVIVRPSAELSSEYAYLYLTSSDGRSFIQQHDNGSAQPNLAAASLKKYWIPLPPLAEQSRIVARVASLRALCADLRQRLTTARTQQALLAQALVQEVV